jgi:hypothetical protein
MAAAATSIWAPKHPRWFRATFLVCALSLLLYIGLAWWAPWQPGRLWGLVFGSVAAALFVNAALYPLRRRLQARPLGTVQRWLQLHIYGSVVALVLVLAHMGFRWPAGAMGWWLFALTVWTTATGVLGVILQKWLPPRMARNLRIEVIYERVPEMVERLRGEADTVMTESGSALRRVYEEAVKPLLAAPRLRWASLFDLRGVRARLIEPLTRLESYVEDADRDRLRSLLAITNDKLDLDVHASLQRALRVWLLAHVPPAMLLIGLLVVHVAAVVYL